MRYLMLVVLPPDSPSERGELPNVELVERMTKYNEELAKAGVLLSLDGLHPTSKGARVDFRSGTPRVTDGPFAETREVVGGYWLIKVDSRDEAIAWAKRAPFENEAIELRQVFDMEDFPEDIQKAAQSETLSGM